MLDALEVGNSQPERAGSIDVSRLALVERSHEGVRAVAVAAHGKS